MRLCLVGCLLAALVGCKFADLPPIDETGDGGGPDADLNNPQPLTVTVTGEGSVTSDPAGVDCGSTCMADFDPLSMVTLTATPAASSTFEGWSGACSGSTATCTVTMDGAKTVAARFAIHGAVRWVNHVQFTGSESIDAIAVDLEGNVIVAGLAAPGEELDFFVAKYSSVTGQTMWMQHFVTLNPAAFETFGGMALDAAGNVYIAGGIQGNGTAVTYAPGHTAIGDLFHNIVALRLNGADGSVAWVKHWGGSAQDRAYGIAVSGSDVYIHGTTSSNPSTFDSHTLAGSVNMPYILRASAATGTVAQVRALQGSINAIAVNGNNVLLGGAVAGMFSIDGVCGGTPTASGSDGYLLMLTGSSLSCTWSRHFGSNTAGEDTFVRSVASFADGSWAVAGTFEGSISGLTSTSLSSAGAFDALAIRLAIDGTHQWSFRYGGTGSESVQSVATSTEGNVLLAGNFTGDITFGAHTVSGTNNVFVTRMSTAAVPTHEWAVSLGGAEGDSASDIAVAADGYVFASGTFSGMTTIGTTSLAAQQSDAWVAGLVR